MGSGSRCVIGLLCCWGRTWRLQSGRLSQELSRDCWQGSVPHRLLVRGPQLTSLSPCHVSLYTGWLTGWQMASLRENGTGGTQNGTTVFCNLVLEEMLFHFCHVLFVKSKPHPDLCGSVGWVSSCKVKGHQFHSWPGHVCGLRVQSPVATDQWFSLTAMFLSLFLPPFSSL